MGPALKWLVQLEEPEIRSVVWRLELRLRGGMDRRERLDLDHNPAAVRRDHRMPEEHGVGREERAAPPVPRSTKTPPRRRGSSPSPGHRARCCRLRNHAPP